MEANRERASLTNKLITLKRRFASENVQKEIVDCETKFKVLIERKTTGAEVRSRAKFIEEGEKPSHFFF